MGVALGLAWRAGLRTASIIADAGVVGRGNNVVPDAVERIGVVNIGNSTRSPAATTRAPRWLNPSPRTSGRCIP